MIVPKEKNKNKKVGEKEVEVEEEEEEEISKDGDIELEPAVPHKEVEMNVESEHPGSGQAPPEERLEDGFQMQNGTEFGLGNNSTEEVVRHCLWFPMFTNWLDSCSIRIFDIYFQVWHQNTEGGELAGSSVGPIVGGVIAVRSHHHQYY